MADEERISRIDFHNKIKSGVDLLDMKYASYCSNRKSRRWPMADIQRLDFMKGLAKSLVVQHMNRRVTIPNLPNDIKIVIKRSLEPDAEEAGTSALADLNNKLEKRKTCSLCPYQKKRKMQYKCIKCLNAICLECSKKVCNKCVHLISN